MSDISPRSFIFWWVVLMVAILWTISTPDLDKKAHQAVFWLITALGGE